MSGEITAADLDHFERTLEALALECKITDEHMFNILAIHGACLAAAVDKERSGCIADIAAMSQMAKGMGDVNGARALASAADALKIRN